MHLYILLYIFLNDVSDNVWLNFCIEHGYLDRSHADPTRPTPSTRFTATPSRRPQRHRRSPVTGESNQRSERAPSSTCSGSKTRSYTHLRGDAVARLTWLVEWFSLGQSWGEGHLLLVGAQLDQYGYSVGNLLTPYKDKAFLDIN